MLPLFLSFNSLSVVFCPLYLFSLHRIPAPLTILCPSYSVPFIYSLSVVFCSLYLFSHHRIPALLSILSPSYSGPLYVDIDGIEGGDDEIEGGCFVLDVGDRVIALKKYFFFQLLFGRLIYWHSFWSNRHTGSVAFIGPVHYADGIFVGVVLDNPVGKNDGTFSPRYVSIH